MARTTLFSLICIIFPLLVSAQTDETIFREFEFDFSTPGARANAMGRAFVGLADEATAAYNNPAGISVLSAPEFAFELRRSHNDFEALRANSVFTNVGEPSETQIDLSRVAFASFSYSFKNFNLSLYYVNHLDYKRPPVEDQTVWLNQELEYEFTYINNHHVRKIALNNYGLSLSRSFGKLSVGLAVGASRLDLDYNYNTSFNSSDLLLSDLVFSNARDSGTKFSLVMGALYQLSPKWRIGLVHKMQPRFEYTENINNSNFPRDQFPEGKPIPITFKVPDSSQIGIAWQPSDRWTLLLDLDYVRYSQLVDNLTILSAIQLGNESFSFQSEDFHATDTVSLHLGGEYLHPFNSSILAFRSGVFFDPDHKTRFIGTPSPQQDPNLYDIQNFIFNTGDQKDDVGYTLGLGYVWKNKIQVDVALVKSDRFDWAVTSVLYRF